MKRTRTYPIEKGTKIILNGKQIPDVEAVSLSIETDEEYSQDILVEECKFEVKLEPAFTITEAMIDAAWERMCELRPFTSDTMRDTLKSELKRLSEKSE